VRLHGVGKRSTEELLLCASHPERQGPGGEQSASLLHGAGSCCWGAPSANACLPKGDNVVAMTGAFDPERCGSIGPNGWHLKYAELHRRILAGEAPQRYAIAQARLQIHRGIIAGK